MSDVATSQKATRAHGIGDPALCVYMKKVAQQLRLRRKRLLLNPEGYAWLCINARIGNALYSAEEGGQTAAPAPEDLASITAREQRQITTAGLVPAGLWRLGISPGHSGPAARACHA